MFFRRKKPRQLTFADRLESARQAGFTIEQREPSRATVSRGACAAVVEEGASLPRIGKAGILVRGEIGVLVDGGYQKFIETPGGKRLPALASDLKILHDFDEDLREALGVPSLYNESLGTTCDSHAYDRVAGRE